MIKNILAYLKKRKLCKARENAAYWQGVVQAFESFKSIKSYDLDDYCDAVGNLNRYKAMVANLESENN